jgi:hypothetical protein
MGKTSGSPFHSDGWPHTAHSYGIPTANKALRSMKRDSLLCSGFRRTRTLSGRSGGFRNLGAVSGRCETSIPSASVRRKIESRAPPPTCKPRRRITSLQERPREIAALRWSSVHVRGLPMPGYYGAAYAYHPLLCRVYQLPPRAVRCNHGTSPEWVRVESNHRARLRRASLYSPELRTLSSLRPPAFQIAALDASALE